MTLVLPLVGLWAGVAALAAAAWLGGRLCHSGARAGRLAADPGPVAVDTGDPALPATAGMMIHLRLERDDPIPGEHPHELAVTIGMAHELAAVLIFRADHGFTSGLRCTCGLVLAVDPTFGRRIAAAILNAVDTANDVGPTMPPGQTIELGELGMIGGEAA